ncbi:hypothetical protein M1403_03355 [Patescibacteria group bacterium]|nr:hypothetical protein [Patescibacteria group bacterium]
MTEQLFIIFLLIVGISQLVLAIYLLGLGSKVRSLLTLAKSNSLPGRGERAMKILGGAYSQAKNILSQAELTGIKMHAETSLENKKIADQFAREMAVSSSRIEQIMFAATDKANSQFVSFLDDLKNHSQKEEELVVADSRQRVGAFLDNFEKEMAEAVKADMDKTQKALADYKTARMAALDESFIAAAQRALEIILSKRINLADQAELVNEALEQAKKEKLIT